MSNRAMSEPTVNETCPAQMATPGTVLARLDEHEEYGLLMSLALDGLLGTTEKERLRAHLDRCVPCARQWQIWHELDKLLLAAPLAAPQMGFVGRFEERLTALQQRRQRWLGISLGILAVILWSMGLASIATVCALVLWNQTTGLGELVHRVVYLWASIAALADPVRQLLSSMAESPSVLGAAAVYVLFAVLVLSGWTRLLRRTTLPLDVHFGTHGKAGS